MPLGIDDLKPPAPIHRQLCPKCGGVRPSERTWARDVSKEHPLGVAVVDTPQGKLKLVATRNNKPLVTFDVQLPPNPTARDYADALWTLASMLDKADP